MEILAARDGQSAHRERLRHHEALGKWSQLVDGHLIHHGPEFRCLGLRAP